MFENLSDRLDRAVKTLKGQGKISEINVNETVREVRRALLDADVNYKVAKEFTDQVKQAAIGQNVLTSITPGQLFVKVMNDELIKLMGGKHEGISFSQRPPTVILMAGLQGSGKTTFSGKLANMLREQGRTPLLIACDVYRPAAIDQLGVLGEQIGVEVYKETENKNPVQIAQNGIEYARKNAKDVVIIDTAGRLAVDEEMMNEIAAVKKAVQPNEILFVVDAMTGQDAVNTAKAFNDRLDFTGVILTKMDGDTRGGAALSIRAVVSKPVKFVGTGEKMDGIDRFHPERMASRILGMGDVVTLVERAQAQFDQEQSEKLERKLRKNQFDFEDFLQQLQTIKKMGNLTDLIGMIPGMGKVAKNVDVDDKDFKRIEAIIQSMTRKERQKPELIDGSRRKRIADGSGTSVQDVNQLLKQFNEMKKMMKTMNKLSGSGRKLQSISQLRGR
ncbi:MAG: signal recognition particle protein [Bacteroidetes bacterium]|nr:signal recognition particle protein [Bacteroidota bacterium]